MTPNETEMREANEWMEREYPNESKSMAQRSETAHTIRDAYAAALAKCRVERERYVGHCHHCKTTIQNKDGCVVDSRGMFHPICAATLAERERCAQIAESFPLLMSSDTRPIRLAIAAAIRGGGA